RRRQREQPDVRAAVHKNIARSQHSLDEFDVRIVMAVSVERVAEARSHVHFDFGAAFVVADDSEVRAKPLPHDASEQAKGGGERLLPPERMVKHTAPRPPSLGESPPHPQVWASPPAPNSGGVWMVRTGWFPQTWG